jgi:S1-C subfamily serine protease
MDKIVKIIEKVLPAVVSIVVLEKNNDSKKLIPEEILPFISPEQKKKLQKKLSSNKNLEVENGSGFVVSSNGLILTNKHIVSKSKNANYLVITSNDKKYKASVLSIDPINDVAILKINEKNLPTIPLGDSSKIKLGQGVIAIGNALGIFKNTVSYGIISGISRHLYASQNKNTPAQELRGLIQTDAAINPGNSGGPLINLEGKVIGINSVMVQGAENIGFAIPINTAKRDLEDIKKYGKIKRPFLGVRYLTINDEIKEKLNLPFNYGAIVISEKPYGPAVIPKSPADLAGIKEKDIILECNNKKINVNYSILDILEEKNVGDILNLLILRNNKKINVKVKLALRTV